MTLKESDKANKLIIGKREDAGNKSHVDYTITAVIDEVRNKIDIKYHIEVEYGFQKIHDNGESYFVTDNQALFSVEVEGTTLTVCKAAVIQNVEKDSFGYQSGTIVEFSDVYNTMDATQRRIAYLNKIVSLDLNPEIAEPKNFYYTVPEGYKITDGVTGISSMENAEGKAL